MQRDMLRLLDDLSQEYVTYGGATPAFFHCIDDDVEEHNPHQTRITLTSAAGKTVYQTPPLRHSHHQCQTYSVSLADGSRVELVRDTENIRHFLLFLFWSSFSLCVVLTSATGAAAYVIGGRILQLNRLIREKDAAYAELRSLTDDIAHDLRTPLTRLAMAAETADAEHAPHTLPAHVIHETHALLELINTMLAISQANAHLDHTPREMLDLTTLVQTSAEIFGPLAEEAGIVLTVTSGNAPVTFSGHKGKIQQLIANLLENALKYTPAGGHVTLTLHAEPQQATLTVSDTGIGIASTDLPHVFQRFWRADSSRHLPGNGLGLALVHAIVTSYGGTVGCTSTPGQGSTFTVTLPC